MIDIYSPPLPSQGTVVERLIRQPAKLVPFGRVSSNLTGVDPFGFIVLPRLQLELIHLSAKLFGAKAIFSFFFEWVTVKVVV